MLRGRFGFLKYLIVFASIGAIVYTCLPTQMKAVEIVSAYNDTLQYSTTGNELVCSLQANAKALAESEDPLMEEIATSVGTMSDHIWVKADRKTPVTIAETTINSTFPRRGGSDKLKDNTTGGPYHNGTDFGCKAIMGEGPIYQVALWSGTVIIAQDNSSYGKYVVIDHGHGFYTLYAHMGFGNAYSNGGGAPAYESKAKKEIGNNSSSLLVKVGDHVEAGQPLGTLGTTGSSTGAHAHIELKICPNGHKYAAWRAGATQVLFNHKPLNEINWYYGTKAMGFGAATDLDAISGIDSNAIVSGTSKEGADDGD